MLFRSLFFCRKSFDEFPTFMQHKLIQELIGQESVLDYFKTHFEELKMGTFDRANQEVILFLEYDRHFGEWDRDIYEEMLKRSEEV